MRPPKQTKGCSFCLNGTKHSIFIESSSEGGSAESVITCALNGVESTLGIYPCLGLRSTLESLGLNSRQVGLTESACKSPIRLTDANANSRAAFSDRDHRSIDF